LELDVRLASDGVPVVIHDSTLRRTGLRDGVIREMTSLELGNMAVGNWFNRDHPGLARAEYASQTIPTLSEVLRSFKAESPTNKTVVYVEMKMEKGEEASAELPDTVVRLTSDCDLRNRVIVVSFNLTALARIKRLDPDIRTGALFEPKRSAARIMNRRRLIAAAIDSGADEILMHRLIATRRLVELAAEKNLRSVVWTVDDPKWLSRAVTIGIHALMTNDPARMIGAQA
jgi:glycerophosphoryl diester phosphodiesterase